MSDTERTPTAAGPARAWTDKERLVYLYAAIEQSGSKLDFKNTPRPNGRSEIACQRMVDRLKTSIKDDLEALKAGQPFGEINTPKRRAAKATNDDGTPKTPASKRKAAKSNVEGKDDGSPKKRGRGKNGAAAAKDEANAEDGESKEGDEFQDKV